MTMLIASVAVGLLPPGTQMPMAGVVAAMGFLTMVTLLLTRVFGGANNPIGAGE
ncbi:MAG: hypothetical protein HQ495_14615, partial [Alphaproteobacteria bacterium]|nr:hypothetical protein [Alphaproteobacteria bacterium]